VIANIKGQKLGPATVADLALPDSFVRRVAGRTLQAWFGERFRIVVDDIGAANQEPLPPPASDPSQPPASTVRVPCPNPPASAEAPARPPPSRNFRWPSRAGDDQFPYETPAGGPALIAELSTLIARSLAKDGLLLCAARALAVAKRTTADLQAAEALSLLRQAGLPSDLLPSFRAVRCGSDEHTVVDWLMKQLGSASPERLRPALAKVPFDFGASAPGFTSIPDSGQVEPETLRIQLTRAGYYAASGDGGSLDILRQLLEKTRARLLVHAQEHHAAALPAAMRTWPTEFRDRITLLVQSSPLSQWAQDSAKPGRRPDGHGATLTPRFASRGEEASQLVVGDSCIGSALQAGGHEVIRSPLLFQGGNLLTVQEPSGRRTLLIGEAEVHRNRALGFSYDQALAALATEFGADKTAVLPAASMHLDYEISVRAHQGGVVALVNDTRAALEIILTECVGALSIASLLSDELTREAREHIDNSRFKQLLDLTWPILAPAGRFPLSIAKQFKRGEADSGVGNFLRFLGALDVSAALSRPGPPRSDPYLAAYLHAIERQEQDRAVIKEQLRALGWKVHPVPSLSFGDRSTNALNGIHTPTTFLMPAYGGLFAPLDGAAAASISHAFTGQVEVVPVLSGESQRRDGAVHCSVSVMGAR
jgi:hypothetical protein